jgi:hypothetical protein
MTQEHVRTDEVESQAPSKGPVTGHERHCFVVMPYGRSPAEARWFKGWYDVVIKPAISGAGFEPRLSSTEEQPSAINDEIRAHLAFDPMVVVDLGGVVPDADPNPNVMYELGIRHALGLPLVMMAWKGQRLPFDVGNQRVIMEGRELLDLETNRVKLVAFIRAATAGSYYRPMEAVGRSATIEIASVALGADSLLGVLAREVKDLRDTVAAVGWRRRERSPRPTIPNVKKLLGPKAFRKEVYPCFVGAGGTPKQWAQLLRSQLPPEIADQMSGWGADKWKEFVVDQARQWAEMAPKMGGQSTADEGASRVGSPQPLGNEVTSVGSDAADAGVSGGADAHRSSPDASAEEGSRL